MNNDAATLASSQQAAQILEAATSTLGDQRRKMIKKIISGQMNEMDLVEHLLESEGFDRLAREPEAIHRVLETFPLMAAIPEMKAASGGRLSDADTMIAFRTGMKSCVQAFKAAMQTTADPDAMTDVMLGLQRDPAYSQLFTQYMDGDPAAREAIRQAANQRLFPVQEEHRRGPQLRGWLPDLEGFPCGNNVAGLDASVLDEVGNLDSVVERLEGLASQEEIMTAAGMDPFMNAILRDPAAHFRTMT